MGLWADGKSVQPMGTEFKINTALSSASSHTVGYNPVKNEFLLSWLEVSGLNKKIYAKIVLSTGTNLHAENLVYSISDTLKLFLGGDKIAVDTASGKYMIPFMQTRSDISRPKTGFQGVYYPYGLLDVYALKFSTNGATINMESPKLLQTKTIPNNFNETYTQYFTIQSAVDFDSKKKLYCLAWNFMGERRAGYGGGSSGEITSVLYTDDIKLIVSDENLITKSENYFGVGNPAPRNLSMLYNPSDDQVILVWSGWEEFTTASGSNDYSFEVYQRIFLLQNNGDVVFKNLPSIVSKRANIRNYGSGLPSLSWSKKRNEYLIT